MTHWINALLLPQWWLLLIAWFLHPGDVAGQQFTAPTPTCPGETFTFTCTVVGNRSGFTLWRVGGSSDCILAHSTAAAPAPCGSATAFTVTAGTGFGATGPSFASFTSTLSGTANTTLNDTRVECFPDTSRNPENRVGDSNLQVVAPPAAPGTLSVTFPIPGQQFTVTWDEPPLSMGGTVDTYFVNVSGPNDLCGSTNTLQRVTERSYECSRWSPAGQRYTFTVAGATCGGDLRGPESEPVTVTLQVPSAPTITNVTVECVGGLISITSQINESAPVDIAERLMDGSLINYTFTYMRDDGSVYRPTSIVLSSECSDGVCVDMFDTQISSVPPPYTVSVTATNVVGEGNASTSQMIPSMMCPTSSMQPTTPPSTTPTTTGPTNATPPNTGAIVGGVVGGICLVLVILIDVAQFLIWLNKRSHISMTITIVIVVIESVTLVGIPFAIAICCCLNKTETELKKKGTELENLPSSKEKSPDKTPPPVEGTDSAPAPIVYADPNTISREEHPTTGDVYTMPDKSRKTHKPPDHQDPLSHEAAPTGELYTVPDKKKGAKKKQPQASRPTEEQLAEMYSQPDKTRKQQSQGLNYADVGFKAPSSGKVPDKPPQVFYSDVNVKNV